jgi:hypothetical protein
MREVAKIRKPKGDGIVHGLRRWLVFHDCSVGWYQATPEVAISKEAFACIRSERLRLIRKALRVNPHTPASHVEVGEMHPQPDRAW